MASLFSGCCPGCWLRLPCWPKMLPQAAHNTMSDHNPSKPTKEQLQLAKRTLYATLRETEEPIQRFDLSRLLAANPVVLGHKNTPLRKSTQKLFYYLAQKREEDARRAINKFMDGSTVPPKSISATSRTGDSPRALLEDDEQTKKPKSTKTAASSKKSSKYFRRGSASSSSSSSSGSSLSGSASSIPSRIVSRNKSTTLHLAGYHTAVQDLSRAVASVSINQTPTVSSRPADPYTVLNSPVLLFNSPRTARQPTVRQSTMSVDSDIPTDNGRGTYENPWIVPVDTEEPERTRDFEVVYVNQIRVQNHQRAAFHIRKMIEVDDRGLWEATIPFELSQENTKFRNRCVLVRGPSRPSWFRTNDQYHRAVTCQATADAHAALQLEIEADDSRRGISYWLIVFPPSILLDNRIISGDPEKVNMATIPMKKDIGNTEIKAMAASWVVAVQGGRRVVAPAQQQNDVGNMFNF